MKHKLENSTNDDIKTKKKKCGLDAREEILLIKQNLSEESTVTAALKQFFEVISSQKDGVKYVEQYLIMSPQCKDLFAPMIASKSLPDNLVLVWSIVGKILTILSENDETEDFLNFSAHPIVCNILYSHLDIMYFSLNKIPKLNLRSSALNCLAVMLSPGIQTVREFMKCFQFSSCYKQLKECAKVSKKGSHEEDTRSSFVRFYLALLVFGDVSVIKQLLEEKNFSSLLMGELHLDKVDNIVIILETIDDKIVKEANLLRTSKLLFFSHNVLLKLTFLMKHADDTIKSQATKMLTILCTHHRYGICFPQKDHICNGRLANPVLLKFLISVKQSAVTREEILDLTIDTLSACRDIIVPYMNSLHMAIDPRMSDVWCSRITFLVKLWEGLPSIDSLLAHRDEASPLKFKSKDFVLKLVIPPHVTRQLLTQGMKNKVNRVKLATLQLLELSLRRCVDLKSFLQQTLACKTDLSGWLDAMICMLPDVTPLIGIRQMAAHTTDKTNESGGNNDIANEDGDGGEGKLLYDAIEMDILLNSSIKCLNMYQILRSGILTLTGFNISKLLLFSRPINEDIVNQSLDILLNETGAYTWVRKKASGGDSIFYVILKVMVSWYKNEEIIVKSKKLFFKILNVLGQFNNYTFEIDSWVTHFLSGSDGANNDSLVKDFAGSCTRTISEPYMYLENISKLFKDQSGFEKAEFNLPSPLFFAVLRSTSSEIVIRQNIIPVLKELLVTHHSPRLFIQVLTQEIPEDGLSLYEEFFVYSYQWMQGLGFDVSFIPIDQFKSRSLNSDKKDELTCINQIIMELVNINGSASSDHVNSMLGNISQMKERFNSTCAECPVASIDVMTTFLKNVINFLYSSRASVSSSSKLKEVFHMIEAAVKILVTRKNDVKASQCFIQKLSSLPLFENILDIKEKKWKTFCHNIYVIFLECCGEFKSMEMFKGFIDRFISKVGTDTSGEAVEVFCKFCPYLGGKLTDVARGVVISLVFCSGELCDEYYTNCLKVLKAIKGSGIGVEMGGKIPADYVSKFLHTAISCENSAMMDVASDIISLFHIDGTVKVAFKDYKLLLKLDKPFIDCAVLMSWRNFQIFESSENDNDTVCSAVDFNDKFVHDIIDGNVLPDNLVTNLLPLLINVFKMNTVSVKHAEFATKVKLLVWDVVTECLDKQEDLSVVSLLKVLISYTTEEEKIDYLNRFKLLVGKKELRYLDLVFECWLKSCSLLSDGKKQKICLLNLIGVVMETIVRDDITDHMKVLCMQCLINLVLTVRNFEAKLKSAHYNSVAVAWEKFVKKTLKTKYNDNVAMSVVMECVSVFCVNKRFMKACSLQLTEFLNLIISHSKFFNVIFDESKITSKNKVILIKTISKLSELSNVYRPSLVPMLLATYEASLSEKDQIILSFLCQFEKRGISLSQFYPFVWGSNAINAYKEKDSENSLFNEERSSTYILQHIDKHKMAKSASEFPIHLNFENYHDLNLCKENYNPLFFLPLFVNLLQPECEVDCYHFMESGCLPFVLAAISSLHLTVRKLAFCALSLFNDHLNGARLREKNQVTYLLMLLKNSVTEENMRFPSIWTSYFSQYIQYVLKPDHHLYTVLNNLLLQKPTINTRELPVFLSLFNSYTVEHNAERCWLLRLLADGLKDMADYYLYRKYHVFELLLAFYDSPICDDVMKQLIHNVFVAACVLPTPTFDLVKTNSILSWIHGYISEGLCKSETSQFYNLLSTIVNTFRDSYDADANADVGKLNTLPKFLFHEIALVCEHGLQNPAMLCEKDYVHVVFAYGWVLSTESYFGDINLWLQDIDLSRYFDTTTDFLLKTQCKEDRDKVCAVLCNLVSTLLEKDEVSFLKDLRWKELYHLGKQKELKILIDLFDRLIQWCNRTENKSILINTVMYAIG